jgi:cytochrome b
MAEENEPQKKIGLWDLPTRLFHMAIIGLVGFSWYTAENMHVFTFGMQDGLSLFELHVWSGTTLLVLIVFRLLWGVVGSTTSRFSYFVKGPGSILAYLRGAQGAAGFGHNPLGALSVLALILLLLAQPIIGLLSAEDTFGLEGPLSHLVTQSNSYWFAGIHDILFNVLLAFLALHITAVIYYIVVKKDNLITPMITGQTQKNAPEGLEFSSLWRALAVLAIAATIVWTVLSVLAK